jgi:dienelactone hydrolase
MNTDFLAPLVCALERVRKGGRPASLLVAALLGATLTAGCGGGEGSTAAMPSPGPTSGALTVADCTIAAGASSCVGSIAWSSNAVAPRVLLAGATLATTASGSATPTIGPERLVLTLLDGSTRLDEKSVGGSCASASAWDGTRCAAFATRSTVRAPTPFTEAGLALTLEVVIFAPPGTGPFPLVVFHHGSTGNGDDPAQFRLTYTHEAVARYFAERGWMVAFPQRRGRGASDGRYDEGFTPDRSRYSCLQAPALAGLERAVGDADAAVDFLRTRPEVDAGRILAAGFSRGGLLAAVHAARRPLLFRGVVNFVGGWLGEGCVDAVAVHRAAFAEAAGSPATMTWLYGEGDPFYSVAHSQANFDAFLAGGGKGTFSVFRRAPGLSGHLIINEPQLWGAQVDALLRQIGG